jgi:hypothetical protein
VSPPTRRGGPQPQPETRSAHHSTDAPSIACQCGRPDCSALHEQLQRELAERAAQRDAEALARKERTRLLRAQMKAARDAGLAARHARRLGRRDG